MQVTDKKQETLIEVCNLKKYFPLQKNFLQKQKRYVYAVDDVSFHIRKGETLGLVGESGCGKSTTGRTMLRLLEPTGGEVLFNGENILDIKKSEMGAIRRRMQIIFQDPYGSLNPRMTVEEIVGEAVKIHQVVPSGQVRSYVLETMERCGLNPDFSNRFPHEFSGGQRQRIGIARALALKPEFVVADEPVSALDVSIRSQILNLIMDLQKDMGLTYLFISHDLSVVKHISDRIGVMYLGSIIEMCDNETIYKNPCHPYTQALLSAIPKENPSIQKNRIILSGEFPSATQKATGCKFFSRCQYAQEHCKDNIPPLREIVPGHLVACHFAENFEIGHISQGHNEVATKN